MQPKQAVSTMHQPASSPPREEPPSPDEEHGRADAATESPPLIAAGSSQASTTTTTTASTSTASTTHSTASRRKVDLDAEPSQRIAVLFVLSAIRAWRFEEEKGLYEVLERKLRSRLGLCNVRIGQRLEGGFVFRSAYWSASLLGEEMGDAAEKAAQRLAEGKAALDGTKPSAALLDWTVFTKAYRRAPVAVMASETGLAKTATTRESAKTAAAANSARVPSAEPELSDEPGGSSVQYEGDATASAHRSISAALAELAAVAGGDAPLVIVCAHCGCVPLLLHVVQLQQQQHREQQQLPHGANGETLQRALCRLERGDTLAALYSLGCPLPLYLALHAPLPPARSSDAPGHAQAEGPTVSSPGKNDTEPSTPPRPQIHLQVPSSELFSIHPSLKRAPACALGWTNFYHPAEPLAYPMRPSVLDASAAGIIDVQVELGSPVSSSVPPPRPVDYISKRGSREVLTPLAYTLTQLWLASNPQFEVDTTQLRALKVNFTPLFPILHTPIFPVVTRPYLFSKEHGSRRRAQINKSALGAREKAKRNLALTSSKVSARVTQTAENLALAYNERQGRRRALIESKLAAASLAEAPFANLDQGKVVRRE